MLKIILIIILLNSTLCILASSSAKFDNNHPSGSHHNRPFNSDDSDHSGTSTPRSYHSTTSSFNSPERLKSPNRRQGEIVWHDKAIVERHDQLEWHDKQIPRDKHIISSHNPELLGTSSSSRSRPQINEISTLSAGHLTRSPPISPHPTLPMHASTSRSRGARERGVSIRTSNAPRQRATSSQTNHHNTVEQINTSTRYQSPSSRRDPLPSLRDQDHDSFQHVYNLMNEATRRVPINLNNSPSDHRRTQLRQSVPNSPQSASNSRTSHVATSSRQRIESMWDSYLDDRR